MKILLLLTLLSQAGFAAEVEWTRLRGQVKGINLKEGTVTIQNRDNDLLTIPVDYQVAIEEKHGELRNLKTLRLDEKITLIRTPAEKPRADDEGLVPPEWEPKKGNQK